MQAIWNDVVIADSADTVVVEGNHYFPLDHHTTCGWKGTASYFTLRVNGRDNVDAAWYYPSPKAGAEAVANRVAFWKGVKVVP